MIVLHTCQFIAVQECVHHSKQCYGRSETDIKLIVPPIKMYAMATCHGGAGCFLDGGIDLHAEDPEPTDIDNESTHSSKTTVALGRPEAEGHPKDLVYNNHHKLTALMREINDLHQ